MDEFKFTQDQVENVFYFLMQDYLAKKHREKAYKDFSQTLKYIKRGSKDYDGKSLFNSIKGFTK